MNDQNRRIAQYGDLTDADLCPCDGERVITTASALSIHPEGTALLLCADCGSQLGYAPTKARLLAAQADADATANATGSVSATHVEDRRVGGIIVTEVSVPSRPLAQRQADLEAARLQDAADWEAARREEEACQLERTVVFASYDVDNAADMARAAGQTDLADRLAAIATQLRDALPTGSIVPEGTCF